MRLLALVALAAFLAGCGSSSSAPKDDPGAFAKSVVRLIVMNQYSRAWQDMHPTDQAVASHDEYVSCEQSSPVQATPTSMEVVGVSDVSVGLGDGKYLQSKAVKIRLVFPGSASNVLVHTVHVVASGGRWKWILPAWRYRDYKANICPASPGDAGPPSNA